jgi:hypothetical protein
MHFKGGWMTTGRTAVLAFSGGMGLLFLVWLSMNVMKTLPESLSALSIGGALVLLATLPTLYVLGTREASLSEQLEQWRFKRIVVQDEVRRAAPVRMSTGPVQNPGGRIYKPTEPTAPRVRPERSKAGAPLMMRLDKPKKPITPPKPSTPRVSTAFLDAEIPPLESLFVLQPTSHADTDRMISSDSRGADLMELDIEGFTGLIPSGLHNDLPSNMTDSAIIRSIKLAVQSDDESMPMPIQS